jgi:hypothetical protein
MVACITVSVVVLFGAGKIRQSPDNWKLLGTLKVDFSIDYDMIEVHQNEIFTAIKIKVKKGYINVHKSTIHFANGDKQDMDLPVELTTANDEKIILLDGNKRIIKKIGFWYDTNTQSDLQGVIEVWGRN